MTQGASTVASFTNALKVIYPQNRVNILFYRDYTTMAMLKKKDDFYGVEDSIKITVQHAAPSGGRSADFDRAKANISPGREVRFHLPRVSNYQIAQLDSEVIEASSRDVGALMSILKNKLDTAMMNLARDASVQTWGTGGGSRAKIGTISNGDGTNDKVVLENPDDIVAFEIDTVLVTDVNDGTVPAAGTLPDSRVFVRKVDRSEGSIYLGTVPGAGGVSTPVDVTGIAQPWSTGDFIFADGDYGDAMSGIPAYIPYRAPGVLPADLHGVVRSDDADRLAGVSFDGSRFPLEEAAKLLSARVLRNGGRPKNGCWNPLDFADLELSLGTRCQYVNIKPQDHANIGFGGIRMGTAIGPMDMVSDIDTPRGYSWQLEMDGWSLHTLGKFPHQQTLNGGRTLTLEDADRVEFRQVYRGNIVTETPGNNGVVKLATAP